MRMPCKIHSVMFAPCGMDCMVCYKHCNSPKPCAGCLAADSGKPKHCAKCGIKSCAIDKDLTYCFLCETFPCKLIKNLERSYRTRYVESLVLNSSSVRDKGIEAFLEGERIKWTCSCGGVISLHDAACSECKRRYERGRQL